MHRQFSSKNFFNYPDADMLPIGIIDFNRKTNFTKEEQYTLMSLWAIGKSPLIFGGDMTRMDAFTKEMLTNPAMLKVNQESINNRQVSREKNLVVWTADVPGSKDKYVALFNAQSRGDNIDFNNATRLITNKLIFKRSIAMGQGF